MAYSGINEIYAPYVLYQLGKIIEDEGYEAFLYRNTGGRGVVSDMDGTLGNTITPEEEIETTEKSKDKKSERSEQRTVAFTRPVRPDAVAPDLQFQFRFAAVICGLGEIGYSKMLLTPEFGPLQRLAFIFTDAELEYDDMYSGEQLCKKCMACVRECPGNCIPSDKTISIKIEDKTIEWADIDMWKCFAFYTHAGRYYNPFVPKEVFDMNENGDLDLLEGKTDKTTPEDVTRVYNALQKYYPTTIGYNQAKCGGCLRACLNMLEKKGGCLHGKFKEPFRPSKPWRLDR